MPDARADATAPRASDTGSASDANADARTADTEPGPKSAESRRVDSAMRGADAAADAVAECGAVELAAPGPSATSACPIGYTRELAATGFPVTANAVRRAHTAANVAPLKR